jgi:hypothetical protein
LARDLVERLEDNDYAQAALRMLDVTTTDIPTRNGGSIDVTEDEITHALNAGEGPFDPKDLPIRACFDALLQTFEHLEHYIRIDLIKFGDVQYPVRYYVKRLAERDSARNYMQEFEYQMVLAFVHRFGPP